MTYHPKTRQFGIPVLDGGGSFIAIRHDPWSGRPLPADLRDRYFAEIEALGLDAAEDDLPEEFLSENWWLERGL
ncbi:hypothetical protein CSW64_11560 [Caulobacter mirabilis]|uniref:DUF6980 domain-containing protein n=1 Tax=Caulobacter mirabilis TaxID=69666 RepID=A0A2D2B476_9CAUL|nr:hypothetical protein CSW64_11560 [Caulobacter mirabilis]